MESLSKTAINRIMRITNSRERNSFIADNLTDWLSSLRYKYDTQRPEVEVNIKDYIHDPNYIAAYRKQVYMTDSKCPNCGQVLDTNTTMACFTNDPRNTKAVCPNCSTEFQPGMAAIDGEGGCVDYLMMCRGQTLFSLIKLAAVRVYRPNVSPQLADYMHIQSNMQQHFHEFPEEAHQGLLDVFIQATKKIKEDIEPFVIREKGPIVNRQYEYSNEPFNGNTWMEMFDS